MSELCSLACVAIEAVIFVVAETRAVGRAEGLLAEVDPEGGAQAVDDPFAVALLNLLRREISRVVGRTRGVLAARQDEVQELGLHAVVIELAFGADVVDGKYFVFQIIHMTVLSEAYRSLRRLDGCMALAEEMRNKALAVFESAKDTERWNKAAWRDWLSVKGEDAKFPGLQYWY